MGGVLRGAAAAAGRFVLGLGPATTCGSQATIRRPPTPPLQLDIGAEWDALLPCQEEQWQEAGPLLVPGQAVEVRVYRLRDFRLYRFPIQVCTPCCARCAGLPACLRVCCACRLACAPACALLCWGRGCDTCLPVPACVRLALAWRPHLRAPLGSPRALPLLGCADRLPPVLNWPRRWRR